MPRPIYAVIHQDHVLNNLNVAKSLHPSALTYAVVKANAYGHGIENVYPALKHADGFALLDLDEAIQLRELGWQGPILLLEGIFHPQDLAICQHYQLQFAVHNFEQISWLEQQIVADASYQVFLKMNSGMNRLGFSEQEYSMAWHRLRQCKIVRSITHMTHFSDADLARYDQNSRIDRQVKSFKKATAGLIGSTSLSNSAAILSQSQVQGDIIRAGILLYGSSPTYPRHHVEDWKLKPAMSLRSEVIAIQHLEKGDAVGFGGHFVADKKMIIAVVACGYADGYQRVTQSGTPVLVNGKIAPLVGRVSMDMLTVDISHLSDVNLGSEVTLWGYASTGEMLSIDEVAEGSGTIGYELMCAITKRVKVITSHLNTQKENQLEYN